MSHPVDKDEPAPASSAPTSPSSEGVEDAAPAVVQRKLRDGARSKVKSPRELKREVFRNSLEHRGNEKVVADLRGQRPQTRAECAGGQRPCPWVGCKHHLYLDVNPETGAIRINFPDLEPWELQHTCSLDVADRGGVTLEEIGEIMNLTRERIRQIEVRGLLALKRERNVGDLR